MRVLIPVFLSWLFYTTSGSPDKSFECSHVHAFQRTYIKDTAMAAYDVGFYWIDLEVSDTSTFVKGKTSIYAYALREIRELVFELSNEHRVDSIFINGLKQSKFVHVQDLIRITSTPSLNQGLNFEAVVYYQGEGGQGSFYAGISNRRDFQWNKKVTYTLSESFNAHDWFVCKQVLADKADSAYIDVTTSEHLRAGSNGILTGIEKLPGGKVKYKWKTHYPIAYYLLSLSVAEYQDYSFYVHPEHTPDSFLVQNFIYPDSAFLPTYKDEIDKTAELLELFSGQFGIYPFWKEKYGHCYAPIGGGMEHQTMTTLNQFNFTLVAHELAHQWFGDNVTCASWQDIWINEGFASYAEYLALEFLESEEAADVWMSTAHYWAMSEPEGSVFVPEAEAQNEGRIFSRALSYKKGAALLHMIRGELEEDTLFFRVLKRFQDEFRDSTATARDFLQVLNATTGQDFSRFFNQWYYGSGYPEISVFWWQEKDSLHLQFEQSGSAESNPVFQVNMEIQVEYADASDSLIRLSLNQALQKFVLPVRTGITDIIPDPDNWILDQTRVTRRYVSDGDFTFSPNPFREELNVFFKTPASREIRLADLNGKVVKTWNAFSAEVNLNTRQLAEGFYLLTVKEGRESFSARVIKQ